MKRAHDCFLLALCAGFLALGDAHATPANAEDPPPSAARLELGGSARIRFEARDDFRFKTPSAPDALGDEELLLSQLRLRLSWRPSEKWKLFAELQDARLFNESSALDDDATPNVLADDLDLHQAYLEAEIDPGGIVTRLRLGRQKLNLGAKRLVASLEWVNTARVWDAARLTLGTPEHRTLDIFLSRLVPTDPGSFNDWSPTRSRHWNSSFHGIYLTDWKTLEDSRWEVYYLLRYEDDVEDRIHTLGTRWELHRERWDLHAEHAWQTGRWGGLDHNARALHLELGWTPGQAVAGRFHLVYDFGSGDDDPGDGAHQTFDNLFPLNHAYYGAMDFFSLQNVHHLELGWRGKVAKKLVLGLAYHSFWLAETTDAWYDAGGGVLRLGDSEADSAVGGELDVTVKIPLRVLGREMTLESGYGHFFAGDFVTDTGPSSDADFFYLQTSLAF